MLVFVNLYVDRNFDRILYALLRGWLELSGHMNYV